MNSGFEICKFQAKAHMSTCAVFALRSAIINIVHMDIYVPHASFVNINFLGIDVVVVNHNK